MNNQNKCNKLDKIYNSKTKRCNKKCKEGFKKNENNNCISINKEFLLSRKEYIEILKYYNIIFKENDNIKNLRKLSENIIAEKLCKCIKSVSNNIKTDDESKAIAICNKSIIQNKKLKIHKFTCKKKPKLLTTKNNKKKLIKIN
tara:strand:+ start:100 stop:531 length:432 start_codon:yes stop_codon:yes gene_type:complete